MSTTPTKTNSERPAIMLRLPWPPSVNRYWRHNRGMTHISREGRHYRDRVAVECDLRRVVAFEGRLAVQIIAYPPDRRKRDLDNVLKALLDALEYGGCYVDDSQIDQLTIVRAPKVTGGSVTVTMREIAVESH